MQAAVKGDDPAIRIDMAQHAALWRDKGVRHPPARQRQMHGRRIAFALGQAIGGQMRAGIGGQCRPHLR